MRGLIDLIQVRALFTIHFDVDEAPVHLAGYVRIFERFVRHHVAPVAGGVADRKQDRLALVPGELQRFRSPRVPVDGILGVLLEIGGSLAGESVRHVGVVTLLIGDLRGRRRRGVPADRVVRGVAD